MSTGSRSCLALTKTATIRTLAREKLAILGQPFTDEKPKPRRRGLGRLGGAVSPRYTRLFASPATPPVASDGRIALS